MQSNTPKAQGAPRERPLQKSMFLPQFNPQPMMPPRPQPMENIHYNPLKRSSMPVLEGMHHNNLSPSYHSQNISYSQPTFVPPPLSLHINEMRAQSQHELLMPPSSMKPLIMRTEPAEPQIRSFSKFDKASGYQAKSPQFGLTDNDSNQQLISAIVEQLKEKHLPSMLKSLKKELTEQISIIRSDLSSLRLEMKQQNEKQEFFNNEIRSQTGNIINFNTNNINNISKGKKEESDYKELQKELTSLQRKYNQIQLKLTENLSSLCNQFEKITIKLQKQAKEKIVKAGQVRCSLPPLMLQYKETFSVRRNQSIKGTGQDEITIGTCTYFIDRNGYLLDGDNKYLTDWKGHQIRLDEKHLKLLEQHKILQR